MHYIYRWPKLCQIALATATCYISSNFGEFAPNLCQEVCSDFQIETTWVSPFETDMAVYVHKMQTALSQAKLGQMTLLE